MLLFLLLFLLFIFEYAQADKKKTSSLLSTSVPGIFL